LVDEFRQALKDGLAKEPRLEGKTEVIEEGSTDSSPLMVATGSLNGKVSNQLISMCLIFITAVSIVEVLLLTSDPTSYPFVWIECMP